MTDNQLYPIPIQYEDGDQIIHGPWNNYYCMDITCDCHAGDTLWTGAMMSIERSTQKRQALAKAQDPVPTSQLVPMPPGLLLEEWRTEVPRRKRITVWHTIKRIFKKG